MPLETRTFQDTAASKLFNSLLPNDIKLEINAKTLFCEKIFLTPAESGLDYYF